MARTLKIIAIVQARMGSTRLPGKVMKPILGTPLIELLLRRLSRAKTINKIIVAASEDPQDQPLVRHVTQMGIDVFQGSEKDVLSRFYQAALPFQPDVVVRITGDCPLIDPAVVDAVVNAYLEGGRDYVTNAAPPTFPDGLDCEAFAFRALERAHEEAVEATHREHVTPYLRESGKFSTYNISAGKDFSQARWTIDQQEDLEVISDIFAYFAPRTDFSWMEVIELKTLKPHLFSPNRHISRNEGALLGSGQKLWRRAKRVIPGGNMLLSKRPEMFLPDKWPAYFSKAKGCKVWDLNGKEYIDMSIMGIGTNTLGYGHPEVDEAVCQVIQKGNMSTLNCPEEVYLAEKLVELHPWAEMVRLARSGGEANAIAIRIARAASGKDQVAVCGYHGWHDWYLSANLANDKNLDGHLLPGLEARGVPQSLRGSAHPFTYNDFSGLEALVNTHDIGIIKMEVQRNKEPKENFLQKVRKLATDRGIILIFDECTSGFRQTFGGMHKLYGVEPDMAMFGKALGNGYAITAVIGRRAVMESAQATFISSTFWTERIGPTAALKTLEVMEKNRSWEMITKTGKNIRERWEKLAKKHELKLDFWGIPAITGYTFCHPEAQAYKTLVTQEMLAKGFLVGNSVFVCIDHTEEVLNEFFLTLDPVFGLVKSCQEGRDIKTLLKSPVCHTGFARLN